MSLVRIYAINYHMDNLDKYLIKVADNIGKLKYEQLILGQTEHPRRVKANDIKSVKMLDGYYRELYEVNVFIKGKLPPVVVNEKKYQPAPGDIWVASKTVPAYKQIRKEGNGCEYIALFYYRVSLLKIIDIEQSNEGHEKILTTITMKMNKASSNNLDSIFALKDTKAEFKKARELLIKWFGLVKENIVKKNCDMTVWTEEVLLKKHIQAKRIKEATEYIKQHFKEKLTLDQLSGIAGLTPTYFTRMFTEAHNESVFNFIRRLRLIEACHLLNSTDAKIDDIAEKIGYTSPLLLQENFRKVLGISPTNYRKSLIKSKINYIPPQ